MKIIKARITAQPKSIIAPMPEVWVTYEDETESFLFTYYPDEILFHPDEFIGLNKEEAFNLKQKKDLKYLRS